VVLLLLAAVPASADTIVLKNGRRILASGVTEEGDRVSYETPAGRLSLPRSIVARIERNDLAPLPLAGDPVPDGSIDARYLAGLENDASAGGAQSIARLSAAQHAAAQFLLGQGDADKAIDHYRRALTFDPRNVGLLLNLAAIHLRQSQFTAAMEALERARRIEPDSPDVAKLMGWADYGANRIDQAVAEWKRALALRPDTEVEYALAKAERDREEESSYREGETAHFVLKYSGAATPDLAREILRTLEEHFRAIESELDYSPPEPVGVIMYTQQAFADITRAPGWVGALNDGRIRLPVQGLSSVTPELSRVLKHELTHSFVAQKTHGRCPVWLQEGIAQWMEGRRSGSAAAVLVEAYDHKTSMSAAELEGSWMQMPSNAATFAYAWSLAAVESIVQGGSMTDIERILDRIAGGSSAEGALRDVLHGGYADLEQQTAAYLRHAYLR
jgi:tetratricopeptide (TPR) repeat protein